MPKKNKGGRPTIMTSEAVQKLEQAISWGATDLQACFFADLSKSTLYNYQNANPEFVERKEALKSNLGLIAKRVIHDSIVDDNGYDAKWYLERKEQKEYSTQTNQQLLDGDGEPTDAKLVVEFVTTGDKGDE